MLKIKYNFVSIIICKSWKINCIFGQTPIPITIVFRFSALISVPNACTFQSLVAILLQSVTYLVPEGSFSLKMVIFSSLKVKQTTLFPRIKAAALRIN